MRNTAQRKQSYPFLEGGGEMGRLTRAFDWSKTSVGPPETWPQSLRTVVSLILLSDFPMFLWWGDEMIQFYNDAYRPSLGNEGKHPKALGQNAMECWPEIWDIIYPLIRQVRETRKSFFFEDQLVPIYRNGKIEDVYWTFSYSAVVGEAGNVAGVLVVCTETTKKILLQKEKELSQERLKISEANLRSMILQAPVAMCILSGPSHVVEVANDLIIELWGKKPEEVMYKPIFEGLPDAKGQGLEEVMANVYYKGEPFFASERPIALFRNGKYETVFQNFVYEPYRDADGTIVGVLAITIDVTAQVQARQKIEEVVADRTRDLQKSNAELAQFAYIASHDLQEPARKISTFSEMLIRSLGTVDARSEGYLNKIKSSASRMLTLIRDVLAFSQLSNTRPEPVRIDLNEILEAVKSDFELYIEEKSAVIHSDKLPAIYGIPVQISQLFGNLISNALKFTPDKKPVIRITVSERDGKEHLKGRLPEGHGQYYDISFTDNGIGFNQRHAQQIFDIFQRLHTKDEYQGTGIGLAMCKKICENHRGTIYAESTLGQGATFHVILPKEPA